MFKYNGKTYNPVDTKVNFKIVPYITRLNSLLSVRVSEFTSDVNQEPLQRYAQQIADKEFIIASFEEAGLKKDKELRKAKAKHEKDLKDLLEARENDKACVLVANQLMKVTNMAFRTVAFEDAFHQLLHHLIQEDISDIDMMLLCEDNEKRDELINFFVSVIDFFFTSFYKRSLK